MVLYVWSDMRRMQNNITLGNAENGARVYYRVGQKIGPQTHGQNSVKSEAIKKIFTERFLGKFVVKWILKTHHFFHMLLHYLVKHECQQNKPLKHKLQGSVATYLRCGRVVNNKISNGLLLSRDV